MKELCITVEAKVRYDMYIETDKSQEEIEKIVEDCSSLGDVEDELGGSVEENDTNDYTLTGLVYVEEM